MTCPKCGGTYGKRSGLLVCKQCGYQYGTQDVPIKQASVGVNPIRPMDEYEREVDMPDRPGKLNRPLDFDDMRGPDRYEWRHHAIEAMKLKR